MLRSLLRFVAWSMTLFWGLALPAPAENAEAVARELAQKLIHQLESGESVQLRFQNLIRREEEWWKSFTVAMQKAVEQRIAREGESGTLAMVSLSPRFGGYLLVVEIERAGQRDSLVQTVVPDRTASNLSTRKKWSLEKRLLSEQEGPILDGILVGQLLFLLQPSKVEVLESRSSNWHKVSSCPLISDQPLPRNLRGRLSVRPEGLIAYLPGLVCRGLPASPLKLTCGESEAEWPIQFEAGIPVKARFEKHRNYFAGSIQFGGEPPRQFPPFYSGGAMGPPPQRSWILGGLDGKCHLFAADLQEEASWEGWGTEVAILQNPCESSGIILAAIPGVQPETDRVQAFTLEANRTTAVSEPLDFPGVITALWVEESGETARLVTKNNNNGQYAVFVLTISCNP